MSKWGTSKKVENQKKSPQNWVVVWGGWCERGGGGGVGVKVLFSEHTQKIFFPEPHKSPFFVTPFDKFSKFTAPSIFFPYTKQKFARCARTCETLSRLICDAFFSWFSSTLRNARRSAGRKKKHHRTSTHQNINTSNLLISPRLSWPFVSPAFFFDPSYKFL